MSSAQADIIARGRNFSSATIVSPIYDAILFIAAPLLSLAVVEWLGSLPVLMERQEIAGLRSTPLEFGFIVWFLAHSSAVFLRTHANPAVFRLHRFRFVGVPLAVIAGFYFSDFVLVLGLAIAGFWAMFHLGMQNFGLARLYDVRAGNDPDTGRTLDLVFVQVFTLGPFVAGTTFLPTLRSFLNFRDVGWELPVEALLAIAPMHGQFTPWVLGAGSAFLVFYLVSWVRLANSGYRFSAPKIALLGTTSAVSVYACWTMPAWKAFLVMNSYHALQYFAVLWFSEKGNLRTQLGLSDDVRGNLLSFAAAAAFVFLAGSLYRIYGYNPFELRLAGSIGLAVSLLHYWYDGFIWSARSSFD